MSVLWENTKNNRIMIDIRIFFKFITAIVCYMYNFDPRNNSVSPHPPPPPPISFITYSMRARSNQFLCMLYEAPSDQFLHILYMRAPSDQFLHILYGAPFRSVSFHTIWGAPRIIFFAYYRVTPPQISFFAYYMGPP